MGSADHRPLVSLALLAAVAGCWLLRLEHADLQHLLLTWPEQIVAALGALGESSTTLTTEAVGATVPDLVTGLFGGL